MPSGFFVVANFVMGRPSELADPDAISESTPYLTAIRKRFFGDVELDRLTGAIVGELIAAGAARMNSSGLQNCVSVVSAPSVLVDGFEQDWSFGAHGGRVHQELLMHINERSRHP